MVLTTDHPQVHISYLDMEADVDEALAPTILALWREGFETSYSCQGKGHLDDWYEAPHIVFTYNYRAQEMDIERVIARQGWRILDLFAWEGADPTIRTRTVARFVRPGTCI